MKKIILVIPTKSMEKSALSFKNAFFQNGENVINGSAMLDLKEDYDEWLAFITKNAAAKTVPQNWVQSQTFFAVRESDEKMIGIAEFRFTLNDFLKDYGHIGYSVHPAERKKGYGTEILSLLLSFAKEQGLREVQLSCKAKNTASKKVILKNGGKRIRSFNDGVHKADVYVISLK